MWRLSARKQVEVREVTKMEEGLYGEEFFRMHNMMTTLANGKMKKTLSSMGTSPRKAAKRISMGASKESRSKKWRRFLQGKKPHSVA